MSTSTFQPSAQSSSNNFGNSLGFGPFFPGKHAVDEEDKPKEEERMSTPDVKSYLRMTDPDDKFPTLTRRGDDPNVVCAPNNNCFSILFTDMVNVAFSEPCCFRSSKFSHPSPTGISCKSASPFSSPESTSKRVWLAARRRFR